MAEAHWIVGSGPETFTAQFARIQSVDLAKKYPDFHHESPHNMLLDALTAQGIPGAVIILLICALSVGAAIRARLGEPRVSGPLLASLAGMVVSLQFQGLTITTALCLFVNAAMLVALVPATPAQEPARTRFPRWFSRGVCACIAVLLGVFAVSLIAADRSLFLIKSYVNNGNLAGAFDEHTRLIKLQPPGANFELWYSRSLLAYAQQPNANLSTRLEALRHALDAALRATRSAEEPHNAYYNLAAAFAAWNDLPRTVQSLNEAVACSPTWYKPHWLLAKILRQTGDLAEAEKEANLAEHLGGIRHPEVTKERIEIAKLLAPK
jgi:hypothetical protein